MSRACLSLAVTRLLGLCLLCVCVAASADGMYKWVDADGHVHYSQTPPAGTSQHAQSVQVQPPQSYTVPTPAPAAQSAQPDSSAQLTFAQKRQLAQAAAAQARADQHKADLAARQQAQRVQHCADLQSRLDALKYSTNPVDPNQVQSLKGQIAADCSDQH